MCEIVSTTLASLFAGGGGAAAGTAAATGATAAAGTAGTLANIGTLVSIGGTLASGIASYQQGEAQADAYEQQARQTAQLNAIEEQRTRANFAREIRRNAAQISDRGLSMDSPTAIYLGETAAREMAFAGQSVRQSGLAQQTELTNSARMSRARGRMGLLKGGFGAAGKTLRAAPDLWPELLT